jgi:lon-related putative ATP-dependent protease
MVSPPPLPPDTLYRHCDPNQFSFETTAEIEAFEEMLGQDRAVEAIRFGAVVEHEGYNLFVLGSPGTGRHTFVRQFLAQQAATKPTPSDWCYVNNFEQPRRPIAIELTAGLGSRFRADIQHLIEEAQTAIPAALESEDYRSRRQAIEETVATQQQDAFEAIRQHALARGLDIVETATGFIFVPLRKGKAIPPEEYRKLPESERERLQHDTEELEQELRQMLRAIPPQARQAREKIRQLTHDVALFAVGGLMQDLLETYATFPKVVDYLNDLQNDIVDNIELFTHNRQERESSLATLLASQLPNGDSEAMSVMRRYGVNVLVDHSKTPGAPVVFEDHPTYAELIGRIEHIAQIGALVTDFMLIRAGALHRSNGGYLILDAHKVLTQPFTWEALKRVLKSQEIRIKSLAEDYSLISTVSLEPEPVPLQLKVVLIGERLIYYLLQAYDPEFPELFKVSADFEDQMERTSATERQLAHLLGTLAKREGLMPLDRSGVARIIEESARSASDAERLSTQIRRLADIIREAHYWAKEHQQTVIDAEAVEQAINHQIYRVSRIRDRLQEEILRQTLLIDTEGQKMGQINGLAVYQLGDFLFAHPSRITARLSLGSGKVIDIEREVELGGPIHSKGVLILANFLASNYVIDRPLSLSASLVFEQSYAGVEGDSASAAELCVLLSALAELPLRQSLAITGSVSQHGQIQAIGAVNEKIEGFFDICQARGLRGDQGVVIPAANVKHLMLRPRVVDAVQAGQFQIYAVETIDQCMELLTGQIAGERDPQGQFPQGSINQRIVTRLLTYAENRQSFLKPPHIPSEPRD